MEQIALEVKGVLVSADEVGYQVFVSRAVIEDLDVFGSLDEKFGAAGGQHWGKNQKESRQARQDSSLDRRIPMHSATYSGRAAMARFAALPCKSAFWNCDWLTSATNAWFWTRLWKAAPATRFAKD